MADIDKILNNYQDKEVDEVEETDSTETQVAEKTFTQADVDKIVRDRLDREHKKYADHDDLKEIAEGLKAYGYTGSIKEIKAQIKEAAEIAQHEKEIEELQAEADTAGTSPELVKRLKVAEEKLAKIEAEKEAREQEAREKELAEQKAQEEKAAADQAFNEQVSEFNAKYPDISVEALANNQKFMKFARRSNSELTLTEIYDDYVELVDHTEAEALKKYQSKANRSTSSGKANSNVNNGGTYGLTDRQQQLARENGMDFKEYAEILGNKR